jgi:RNA polymerase sigma-70 factor (ECF subfamily)
MRSERADMTDIAFTDDMHQGAKGAWQTYLATLDPVRPALHRYCRRLTGDIWDTEDLIHDTLLRGFALLGSVQYKIEKPEAYILRIATNLWIDRRRRAGVEAAILVDQSREAEAAPSTQEQTARVRDAGAALLQRLGPQERAAILLKDIFDSSLEETAAILGTTTGAVKAALHRGRGKLVAEEAPKHRPSPDPAVIDNFCAAFNARDRDALLALMLDTASIEMTGVDLEIGREAFRREPGWFYFNLQGVPGLPKERQPVSRWERAEHEGETLALVFTSWGGEEQLVSVMRFQTEDRHVARLQVFAFCPDTVREIGAARGLPTPVGWYSFSGMMQAMATQMAQAN